MSVSDGMLKNRKSNAPKNADIQIRPAEPEDADAVREIELLTSASPWSRDSLAKDIAEHDRALVLVAVDVNAHCDDEFRSDKDGGRIIGYADAWLVVGEAQLNNIAIVADYRGIGAGEMLLRRLMEMAAETCDSMNLELRISNKVAANLYKKMDFRQDGIRPGYYEDNNETAVLMSTELRA